MNLKEAIDKLKSIGFSIEGSRGEWYPFGYDRHPYTDRELICLARDYHNNGNCDKHFKHYNNRKNRTKTKEILKREAYDELSRNYQAKEENYWNWD